MALAVMVVFALLLVSAFDEGMQGKDKSIEAVIAEQATMIEDDQAKLDGMRARLEVLPRLEQVARELEAVKRDNQICAGRLERLAKEQAEEERKARERTDKMQRYQDIATLRKRIANLERDITSLQQVIALEKNKSREPPSGDGIPAARNDQRKGRTDPQIDRVGSAQLSTPISPARRAFIHKSGGAIRGRGLFACKPVKEPDRRGASAGRLAG